MSKKENLKEQEEKIVTRYDRKQQRRREQEKKEKLEKKIGMITGIVIVIALAALVASFPIRTYMAVNETYVTVGGEKVTRVEFDYNYNLAMNSYVSQYGAYMSYFGLDLSKDLSTQMYSDTMTWKDYFEQLAVENIVKNKALLRDAQAAGFTYDAASEWKEYQETLKGLAADEGIALNKYLKEHFGAYATTGRLSQFIKNDMLVNAYYEKLSEDKAPTDEEISAYYAENKADYDSVDYRVTEVKAQLPDEPTELADPEAKADWEAKKAEQTANGESADSGADGGTDGTAGTAAADATYQPSEAEIQAAMKEAEAEADKAVKTVAESGTLQENVKKSEATGALRDWLFDDARKAGDTTVVEDSNTNKYYALAFENRYLDETPSVDVRVIMAGDTDAQTILDEWNSGEATEESFIALCEKYSEEESAKENGGLLEAVLPSGMDESLSGWLFDPERKAGDTTAVTMEDGYNYVMYFMGHNEPEWKLSIKSTLLGNVMGEYLEQISEGIEVEDKGGKLNYLKIQAMEEAEASSAAESADTAGDQGAASSEASAETGEDGAQDKSATAAE